MTIEKTFEWLFKRMQNPTIKPCAFDIECLTFLAEWVNREKQTNKQQNILFAKEKRQKIYVKMNYLQSCIATFLYKKLTFIKTIIPPK